MASCCTRSFHCFAWFLFAIRDNLAIGDRACWAPSSQDLDFCCPTNLLGGVVLLLQAADTRWNVTVQLLQLRDGWILDKHRDGFCLYNGSRCPKHRINGGIPEWERCRESLGGSTAGQVLCRPGAYIYMMWEARRRRSSMTSTKCKNYLPCPLHYCYLHVNYLATQIDNEK